MSTVLFKRYFKLEEAVSLLPGALETLKEANRQMETLRDSVILNKRLLEARQNSGRTSSDGDVELLQKKFEAFETAMEDWQKHFAEQGILLRDLDTGLIDFPYHSETTGQDYFLCWRPPEEGIFYFHGIHEGFAGRHPITLLPD